MEMPHELRDRLDAVADADEAVAASKRKLDTARSDLHAYFLSLGTQRVTTGEQIFPLALARYLYWNVPVVKVESIGAVIGVPPGQVHRVVGGNPATTCVDCGSEFVPLGTSRSSPLNPYYSRCVECDKKRDEADEKRSREFVQEINERQAAYAARIKAGDYWIDQYGQVVLPDGEYSECGNCRGGLRRIDDDDAWKSGKGVTYVCVSRSCDYREAVTSEFTVYVPRRSKAAVE